jgi:hypothetical protein
MKHGDFGQKLQSISGILNCRGDPSCIAACVHVQVCRQVPALYSGLAVLSKSLPALLRCLNKQICCQGRQVTSPLAATASYL